jgi:hypothetical protein
MARAKARALIVLAVACAATLAATVPRLDGPVSRLANYRADSADPIWDNSRGPRPTDGAALRRAGELLPAHAAYWLDVDQSVPGLQHDVEGAALLFFAPALRVERPADADWVLNYGARPLLPPGLRPERVYRLGAGVALVQVGK